jgi:hypothetical protein
MKQELIRANLTDPTSVDGKVSCRACDFYLGEISWIRKRINCHFVRQQQFIDRVEIERFPDSQIFKEIQLNGITNIRIDPIRYYSLFFV